MRRKTQDHPGPLCNGLVVVLILISLVEAWLVLAGGGVHGNDFKHLWLGAWLLDRGFNPYAPQIMLKAARQFQLGGVNPYVYPPTAGLLMRPLTWLSFPAAVLAWFCFNWLLAWVIVLAGPSLLRVSRPPLARLAGAAFLAAALPFLRQMTAGQMNVVTAALILWAAAALVRRRPVLAGLALALGLAWKISPALLIAALAALRRFRAGAWGALFSVGLLLLSLGVFGWRVHREALPVLRQMGYGQSTWSEFGMDFYRDPFNQSPNSLMHHLFTKNPYTTPWIALPPSVANALTMFISLAVISLWIWKALRPQLPIRNPQSEIPHSQFPIPNSSNPQSAIPNPQSEIPLFLAASLAMLLLPSLMWDHYCVQALPALLWLFGDKRTSRSIPRALAALAIFALLVIPWPHNSPAQRHGPAILLMSLRLWPIIAMYVWLSWDKDKSY